MCFGRPKMMDSGSVSDVVTVSPSPTSGDTDLELDKSLSEVQVRTHTM